MRWLPPVVPGPDQLAVLAASPWPEFQRWLSVSALTSTKTWWAMRRSALRMTAPPRLSLLMPVHDTVPGELIEAVASIRRQAYPFWEICIVDDGSRRADTLAALDAVSQDPRIRLWRHPLSLGISAATNRALAGASGDFVAFVDHDDRLTPDALWWVAETLHREPDCDLVYSDRDMLDAQGQRVMYLLKPAWSPESLLSGNYLFHLVTCRRSLLEHLGGLRSEYDGSQDYDLMLRLAETDPKVRHIPRVLYDWRQSAASISTDDEHKAYVFSAGMAALAAAMERRGFRCPVSELKGLWRGNYRVHLPRPAASRWKLLPLTRADLPAYRDRLLRALVTCRDGQRLVVLGPGVEPMDGDALAELVAWLDLPGVIAATGRVTNPEDRYLHAGLVHRPSGIPLPLYLGHPDSDPGYLAFAWVLRNISAPHPLCLALNAAEFRPLLEEAAAFEGPHALLQAMLRGIGRGKRAVFVPFARFTGRDEEPFVTPWSPGEAQLFAHRWGRWLREGDPCYHPALSLDEVDCRLRETADFPSVLPIARCGYGAHASL